MKDVAKKEGELQNQKLSSCDMTIFGNAKKFPKSEMFKDTPRGILVDMFQYLGKEMGCHFTIELYPWKRAYKNMLAGKGGVMGLSKNKDRLKIIDYSEVMFYVDLMLIVKKGTEFPFKSIPDLKGKIVSVTIGSSYGDAFEKAIKDGIFRDSRETNQVSSLKN